MLDYTAGTEGLQNACTAAAVGTVFTSRKFLEAAKLEEQVMALKGVNVLFIEDFRCFTKVAGEMVSLEVVEKVARQASPAAEHDATTQPDAQRGENIVLFTCDRSLTREHLQQAARAAGYPEIAVPRKVVPVESLPLLGTGKLDYVRLQQLGAAA